MAGDPIPLPLWIIAFVVLQFAFSSADPGQPTMDCKTVNKEPCIFPFKDGDTEHTECADYKENYTWCATSLKADGSFDKWGKCNKTSCKGLKKRIKKRQADCFYTDSKYSPLDVEGRTEETDADACQARCGQVEACSHFSFWADGGCHLSSNAAVIDPDYGVTAGPQAC